MHKREKKTAKKVLYKHITSWIPASDMQGHREFYFIGQPSWAEGKLKIKNAKCKIVEALRAEFYVLAGIARLGSVLLKCKIVEALRAEFYVLAGIARLGSVLFENESRSSNDLYICEVKLLHHITDMLI